MPIEPPSLAARLEQAGPLGWRETARLSARIARALDRQHARGRVHGGLEPLTVLFVGGTVRLADALPPDQRSPAFLAPAVRAGAAADRQSDFYALGQLMTAMLAGEPNGPREAGPPIPPLPAPLASVQRRLISGTAFITYASGNDIAAALELAIVASEGLAALADESPAEAAAPMPDIARSGHDAPAALLRRSATTPALRLGLAGGLLLAGLAASLWLWPASEREAEPGLPELPPAAEVARGEAASDTAASSSDEPLAPQAIPLEEVLAALPALPLDPPPAVPDDQAALQALLAGLAARPCSRLEVAPSPVGLRLAGSAASAADRSALLAAVGELFDIDSVSIALDRDGAYCPVYDVLEGRTTRALPRLASLVPARDDYRLAERDPLIIRVLTPDFPSHLMVDYFTADGMVVHLRKDDFEPDPLPPRTELRIGDPADGHWLTIAEPFGRELVVAVASRTPLFAEARPQIEPASAYLEALQAALEAQAEKPHASTVAIETRPAAAP